jgi:PAS domain S-box-containing protein
MVKVLLVEDDPFIAIVEKRQLELCGYLVVHTGNGEDAIDYIRTNDTDIVLMDIDLGSGKNGIETAKEILKIKDVPITFLSGHTDKETIQQTELVTNYGYVVKASGIIIIDTALKLAHKLFNAKKDIERSEQIFKRAFHHSKIAMSINDFADNGRFIEINDTFLYMLGYERYEVEGKTPTDLNLYIDPEERKMLRSLFQKEGRLENFRHKFRSKDGKENSGLLSIEKMVAKDKEYILTTNEKLDN